MHTLPSTPETVRLGVFDTTLENVLEIESGDVVVYPDTWSHFLNRLQPGLSIDDIARLRRENPGRGPHSIVGPVGVRGAEPGDMLAIEFQRLIPVDWGATFVNPGDLGTGTLPDAFPPRAGALPRPGYRSAARRLPAWHQRAVSAVSGHVRGRPSRGRHGQLRPSRASTRATSTCAT